MLFREHFVMMYTCIIPMKCSTIYFQLSQNSTFSLTEIVVTRARVRTQVLSRGTLNFLSTLIGTFRFARRHSGLLRRRPFLKGNASVTRSSPLFRRANLKVTIVCQRELFPVRVFDHNFLSQYAMANTIVHWSYWLWFNSWKTNLNPFFFLCSAGNSY